MRLNKTLTRGQSFPIRVVPILLAGGIGYLSGGLNTTALRSADVSAAESVALRFPDAWNNASSAAKAAPSWAAMNVSATNVTSDAQLALLSPEPMIPQTVPQAPPQVNPTVTSDAVAEAGTQTRVHMAALEDAGTSPAARQSEPSQAVAPVLRAAPAVAPQPISQRKAAASAPATVPHHQIINRPGYVLNDAQIASIKERLNLTPDQEQMWPAVEAALRNMAYTEVQELRTHGAWSNAQVAAVDSDAVQGLKSAAVPLIMSFNSEQKEEVRNIVHVMGLDQLASQF